MHCISNENAQTSQVSMQELLIIENLSQLCNSALNIIMYEQTAA